MKLAFSTLGCPGWTWKEIFATAKDMGMEGIEIRGIENEIYAPNIRIFDEKHREGTLAKLKDADMVLTQLTSGASLGFAAERQAARQEVEDYIQMAALLGVPYVRVMISPRPEPEDADIFQAKEMFLSLCQKAKEQGVMLLIETNGMLSDSNVMAKFMEGTDPEAAGVLWDLHHPYRYCGESPEYTFGNIGRYVKNVHVKDSVMKDGAVEYRMMGYGDVPVFDALKVLQNGGYKGFVTLEWVKRWNPDLQEPGIVFYHYNSYMRHLLGQLAVDN